MMIVDTSPDDRPVDPFSDLDVYIGLPRVAGLWLSRDGRRLVVGVATPDRKKARYTTALWEVDPDGTRPARRLTRSSQGESAAAFTPSGDLLFTSSRPEPDGGDDEEPKAALWLQPVGGGDARVVAGAPGGVGGVVVSETGMVVVGSAMMPLSQDVAGDHEIRGKRTEAAVSAVLHEGYPVRHWDHDLGPDRTRLLVTDLAREVMLGDVRLELRDVTGHVGGALDDECTWDVAPDGRTVVAEWAVAEPAGSQRHTLVAIDSANGERRTLADDPDHEYGSPRLSPDGTRVAVVVSRRTTPLDPGDRWIGIVPLAGGPVQALTQARRRGSPIQSGRSLRHPSRLGRCQSSPRTWWARKARMVEYQTLA